MTVGNPRKLRKKYQAIKFAHPKIESKFNLKNTNKPEFIKEAYSKDLFYTLTNTCFIFLKEFAWATPKKYQIADYSP